MTQVISRHWPAPAKLNLFLHVNGQHEDGYHELQTLFQFVDKADYLDFCVTDQPTLTLNSELDAVVPASDNLILKAAKSLKAATGYSGGAEIWLSKMLPMGGGLGGGSSDAATTLVALNALWKTNLTPTQLADIGLALGADVPIFIHGFSALAEGVGEKLRRVNPVEPWYLVVHPKIHVCTKTIFQHPELIRNTPKMTVDSLMSSPWKNDCEKLVAQHYPQVANALAWLIEYAPSRMTGTGACVYGAFNTQQQANAALADMPTNFDGFVAKGMNISPLALRLKQC